MPRYLMLLIALAIPIVVSGPAQAQVPGAEGGRPITLVVPIAAGGGMDTIGRTLAERLQERLKQPVVVENRTGAGGVVGVDSVAKAAPDGRTLLLLDISAVLHKWLHKSVPFDVIADFAPVAQVATTPLLLFALPSFPPVDVKELIDYARANPGKLSAATPGVGSPHHLAAAMLNVAAKVDITHVPYRGTAPALNDLLGGQIPLMWATPNAVIQHVEAGKVKALGVASRARIAVLPRVPTIDENALPGFNVGVWFGIAAPAKTPPELIERLGRELREITGQAEVQKKLVPLGYELSFADVEHFRAMVADDHRRFGTIIREAGIQPN
ncbi:MAG: tripartite tricarboxylate transporter substrate binding protein [Hyphomicrobiales bacterium]|nr:tripartite tricarboxylate transporter substrate binding protein [Hyphomicrobiales bacterium]